MLTCDRDVVSQQTKHCLDSSSTD